MKVFHDDIGPANDRMSISNLLEHPSGTMTSAAHTDGDLVSLIRAQEEEYEVASQHSPSDAAREMSLSSLASLISFNSQIVHGESWILLVKNAVTA